VRHSAWSHGWGGADGPPWNTSINPDGDNEQIGRGLCVRNEKQVQVDDLSDAMRKRDWSHKE